MYGKEKKIDFFKLTLFPIKLKIQPRKYPKSNMKIREISRDSKCLAQEPMLPTENLFVLRAASNLKKINSKEAC